VPGKFVDHQLSQRISIFSSVLSAAIGVLSVKGDSYTEPFEGELFLLLF
jgi:hypothetical protein